MTPYLIAAFLLAAPVPSVDEGAQGCLAYGVFTSEHDVGASTWIVPRADRDGFDVSAVVVGYGDADADHVIVAPAAAGQVVGGEGGPVIDHVHVCLQAVAPPTVPPTVDVDVPPTVPPVVEPEPTVPPVTDPGTSSTSTTVPARRALPATGAAGTIAAWAMIPSIAGVCLVRIARRPRRV